MKFGTRPNANKRRSGFLFTIKNNIMSKELTEKELKQRGEDTLKTHTSADAVLVCEKDGAVFLEADKGHAINHSRSLGSKLIEVRRATKKATKTSAKDKKKADK